MTAELAISAVPVPPSRPREPAGSGARAAVRRVPVPPLAPPFDDEAPAGMLGAAVLPGALPLPFADPSAAVPRLRVVSADGPPAAGRQSPPAGPWCTRFVRSMLETLAGLRPVSQLGAWATPDVCRAIARRATVADNCRDRRRGVPKLRSIHVCAPSAGVAEVCAVIEDGARVRAMALRVEVRGEGWCCTELVVG